MGSPHTAHDDLLIRIYSDTQSTNYNAIRCLEPFWVEFTLKRTNEYSESVVSSQERFNARRGISKWEISKPFTKVPTQLMIIWFFWWMA